jgi:Zn-dependent peptidase ImmA (M78 family)
MFVFQFKLPIEQARAFCLSGTYPIIVLNSDDSQNGRIFSLFHEVCHILFNTNDLFKDQISGTLNQEYRKIEFFCNDFAASLLVPDKEFKIDLATMGIQKGNTITDQQIQKLARSYNVSNEVITRKLLSLKLIEEEFLWTKKRLWDQIAKSAKEKDKEKHKDSGNGRDQGILIVYEKGESFVSRVVDAYYQGRISSSDLSNYLESKLDHLPKIIDRLHK